MKIFFITLFISLLSLVGCASTITFANKSGQSNQQFFQDKVYCQSGASGQSQNLLRDERLIPYEECMLKLGYQAK